MAEPINVPFGFKEDFDLVCVRVQMEYREKGQVRDMIRADFAGLGKHIQEQAAIYRFCDATWGLGILPTPDHCQGFLATLGIFPADESIFKRWGILLLARECAIAAGVLNAKPAISSPEGMPDAFHIALA